MLGFMDEFSNIHFVWNKTLDVKIEKNETKMRVNSVVNDIRWHLSKIFQSYNHDS